MTTLDEFLHKRGADQAALVASVEATIGLDKGDMLLAVGSLVEGLGNDKSYIDLVLITSRDLASCLPDEVALVVGNYLADVQVLQKISWTSCLLALKRGSNVRGISQVPQDSRPKSADCCTDCFMAF